ncbi:hypothetical protein AAFF_G00047670 [Aldrovandia affinis]|uniref:Uncharacterized protein n=1 Tax=Aldrovandia affinis TaxID=143900 RepID=A0AAD7S1R5_9TELE|nr:hypothetical protein AAFF_G00047670 [Aldrovandia affinis]
MRFLLAYVSQKARAGLRGRRAFVPRCTSVPGGNSRVSFKTLRARGSLICSGVTAVAPRCAVRRSLPFAVIGPQLQALSLIEPMC